MWTRNSAGQSAPILPEKSEVQILPGSLRIDWQREVRTKGYLAVYCPDHPKAWSTGYVYSHRIKIELHLGRFLHAHEVVHHKNSNRTDNRIENLEVLSPSDHAAEHGRARGTEMLDLRCPWCGDVFTRPVRQTFKVKHTPLGCTCCSPRCRGRLSRWVQLGGDITSKTDGHVLRQFNTSD